MNLCEQSIFVALRGVFPSPAHTILAQVRNGTGFSRRVNRTADALVLSTFPSRGLWLGGVEIKSYRGDWIRELANPEKAEEISKYCHRWYVAAPAGLITIEELPKMWGLIEVNDKGKAKIVVQSKDKEAKPIDMLLLCSILRNIGESTVPKSEVDAKIKAQAEQLAEHRGQEFTRLREDIKRFEAASGVQIMNGWQHENIGKAVKIVLDSFVLYHGSRIEKLRAEAEEVVKGCDKIIEAMK